MAEVLINSKGETPSLRTDLSIRLPRRYTVAIDLTPLLSVGMNGGLRIAIFSILEEIRLLNPGRFRFLFLTSTRTHHEIREYERGEDQSLCIVDLGGPPHGDKPSVSKRRQAYRFYRNMGVDVFYCPFGDIRRVPLRYALVAWIADVLHRDYPWTLAKEEKDWREGYYSLLGNGADQIQVNSWYTAKSLSRHYGIDPNRTFVTYLAPRKLAEKRGVPTGTPYFLYPANFWMHKNHETLLVAYAHYLQAAGEFAWDLRLTGSPDVRMAYLQTVSASLGLQNHVHFHGFLKTEQFSEIMSTASALVFPSLYEGFGMPVTEAMLLGLPVIASDSGSIPEIGGDACCYVNASKPLDIAKAMIRIAADPVYRERFSAAGLEQAKRFSIAESATLLAERLLEVVETRRNFHYRIVRWKNAGYSCLLGVKFCIVHHLRRLKAILSGA